MGGGGAAQSSINCMFQNKENEGGEIAIEKLFQSSTLPPHSPSYTFKCVCTYTHSHSDSTFFLDVLIRPFLVSFHPWANMIWFFFLPVPFLPPSLLWGGHSGLTSICSVQSQFLFIFSTILLTLTHPPFSQMILPLSNLPCVFKLSWYLLGFGLYACVFSIFLSLCTSLNTGRGN